VKPTTKERTYQKYKKQVGNHILPALGNHEIRELNAVVLQRFTVNLPNEGLVSRL
jgi:hypothetical protein